MRSTSTSPLSAMRKEYESNGDTPEKRPTISEEEEEEADMNESKEDDTPMNDSNNCSLPENERKATLSAKESNISDVKGLLSTGLLEGFVVTYRKGKAELQGRIQDTKYLCGCSLCKYTKACSALEFEKHAGVKSKNQNNNIFLDSGVTLYKLVKELKTCNDPLGTAIERFTGLPPNFNSFKSGQESFQQNNQKMDIDTNVENVHDQLKSMEISCSEQTIEGSGQPAPTISIQPSSWLPNKEVDLNLSSIITQNSNPLRPATIDSIHVTPNVDINSGCLGQAEKILPTSTGLIKMCSLAHITVASTDSGTLLSSMSDNLKHQVPDSQQTVYPAADHLTHVSQFKQLLEEASGSDNQSQFITRSTNMVPRGMSLKDSSSIQPKISSEGGIKKRDNGLHRSIFKENVLPDGSKLSYCLKGETIKTGLKFGKYIRCDCCSKEMSPSQFEAHAGWPQRRQPYHHIYTSDGISLHEISSSLANHIPNPSCNITCCAICGDGNELMHCCGCSKSFHAVCLKLQFIPNDEWYCANCKVELRPRAASSTPRVISSSTKQHLICLSPAHTDQFLSCAICKDMSYSLDAFDEKTEIFCKQCEREYHIGCLKKHEICDLKEVPIDCKWFCCTDCTLIHNALENFVKNESFLSNILEKRNLEYCLTDDMEAGVQSQILSGKHSANKNLLDKAVDFFHETFHPIAERGHDLIPAMIYAEDVAGKLFGGMYCAMITVKSVIVSAGILRVFGQKIVEVPLFATVEAWRRKGYFRMLLYLIEELLCYLNVECLIVPAYNSAQILWMEKNGFKIMSIERLQEYLKDYPLLIFRNIIILEKTFPCSKDSN